MVSSTFAAPPNVTYLYPAGAQRGTTTEITAAGATDKSTKLWFSGQGVSVELGKEKGKFSVKVAADAVPGTYWLRAFNNDGASGLRPFIVGTVPDAMEKEPNDEPKKPQVLGSSSVVVNGQLAKPGDVDCFAVNAKKGQMIVASLEANRTIKSPMDGVLQVLSADGFVLAQNNDYRGLDPQIAFGVPQDGAYIVRAFAFPASPDTSIRFSGAETYVYRLTITTGGFAEHALPLAIGADSKFVELQGWNIDPGTRLIIEPKSAAGESHRTLFDPKIANPLRIRVEPHPTMSREPHDPNDNTTLPDLVPPFSVTSRLKQPRDTMRVPVRAKKGQAMSVQVESRSFGLALDPVVRILDEDQKQLTRAEPPKLSSDTALSFTPPIDGIYQIVVSDLYADGGPRHAFLLRVLLPEPDYDLTVAADRFAIPPGKSLDIPVKIARKNGFAKAIEIVAEGLPAGVKFEAKPPAGKADPNSITIALSAEKAGISGAFRLVGKVKDEPALSRTARAALPEFEEATADLWLTVSDSPVSPVPPKKKK